MYTIEYSALFDHHSRQAVEYYREAAGTEIARKFVRQVKAATTFIKHSPYSCSRYLSDHQELSGHNFKKWNVEKFPYTILFSVAEKAILIEAMYHQAMDVENHMMSNKQ